MSSQAEVASLLHPSAAAQKVLSAEILRPPAATFSGSELNTLAVKGGLYLTARYGLSVLVGIANMFLLTRWIGPHSYGVFVTAVGLTAFLASLTRFGVDTYLVRCEAAPDRRQYDVAFTLVLSNSLILCAAGVAILPLLRKWYADDQVSAPYLALLLSVPLAGLAGIPVAKLERALNYRTAAGIELAGQVIAFLVAAPLALSGLGVWAPVIGLLAWQVFALAAACVRAPLLPHLRIHGQDARRMLAFGAGYSASMRMWQVRSLVNPLLVGRFAGAEAVAMVAIALRVAESIGFVRTVSERLGIAALARVQSQHEQLRLALQKALRMQVLILGTLLCAFAALGPWLVPRILGEQWTGVLHIYPLVAIAVLISSVFNLQASALFVLNQQWAVLRGYACHVSLLALGTLLLLPKFGMIAYGWGELLACAGYVFIHRNMSRLARISYGEFLPWLATFTGILALFAVGSTTLSAMSFVFVTLAVAFTVAVRRKGLRFRFPGAERLLGRAQWRRARTFLAKFRVRGWGYVGCVARYEWASAVYEGRMILRRAWDILGENKQNGLARGSAVPDNLVRVQPASTKREFHFTSDDIARVVERVPVQLRTGTVAEADRLLAHTFCFRGRQEVLPRTINWAHCPEGNVSWQWDLNRHRFFLTLSTAHFYTGNRAYLLEMIELWRDWIKHNPVGNGCNWKYPFEVAARLQNWLWAYFFVDASSLSRIIDRNELTHALHEHAVYLNAHLEYHWPNNHLLLESKALLEFAILFPELDRGARMRSRALQVLQRQAMKQILPDGSHAELCSMYHRIIAGELEELLLLCERRKEHLAEEVETRIRRMRHFSHALLRPDRSIPLLGDSAHDDVYLRFDSTRPEYSDLNYWLWPDPVQTATEEDSGQDGGDLLVFLDAGYAFLKTERAHLVFDFGPFSRCQASNHAHCDALSFELWANGQALVVDPGVYLPWNDRRSCTGYFRGTAAHSTLQIDGQEQSEISENSDGSRVASCRLVHQMRWNDHMSVAGECVPHCCYRNEIRHTREIDLHSERMIVRDRILGSGKHHLSWTFQFAPDIDLSLQRDLLVGLSLEGRKLFTLAPLNPQRLRLELVYGQKRPLRGWVSYDSSRAIPAPLACYSVFADLPLAMEFRFFL